jgi:cell division GTPase FtsZ
LGEVSEAATLVTREVDPSARVFFGLTNPSEEFKGKAKVTLIATGIKLPVGSSLLSELSDSVGAVVARRR